MIFGLLLIWLITAIGLWLVIFLVPGIRAKSTGDLIIAALVLGIINALIRPLLWILTLPLTVITFGIFALFINALMIKVTAAIVPGFEIDSFSDALLAAFIMAMLAISGFIFIQWFLFDSVFWFEVWSESPHIYM